MSLRPGIGAGWFERYYYSDVAVRDSIIVNGVECKVPRYYDKLLRDSGSEFADVVDQQRYEKSFELAKDNSPARLAVRETVTKARLAFKKRSLE